jgi:flavin-dependent dehydrogenase
MPVRATKRGADRTPLDRDVDVLICGASFAGLTVARELAGSGARVMIVDRYEIGEKQTSACAAPTAWLENMGLSGAIQQTFERLVVHTPARTDVWPLPWAFSTFDYRTLCRLLFEQTDAEFDTAKVNGITRAPAGERHTVHTDRGDLRSELVVDALGWRRMLGSGANVQPPEAFLSRGLEVHPEGSNTDLELWLDPKYVPAGYGWSFPAGGEVRVGVGSFDPQRHVKDPTLELARDIDVWGTSPSPRENGMAGYPPGTRFQGNWIPHKLRKATDDGVFFAGDSAGHCLPVTAEGIRTAFYFSIACGRELRDVVGGHKSREEALERYAAFNDAHARTYLWMKRVQNIVGKVNPTPLMPAATRLFRSARLSAWAFDHYLAIAPPEFALSPVGPSPQARRQPPALAA